MKVPGSHLSSRFVMRLSLSSASLLICSFGLLCTAPFSRAAEAANAPPPGFTALWNGKNLEGWWGASSEYPRGFMAGSPHPGKDRTKGHFGFAEHSDPVA